MLPSLIAREIKSELESFLSSSFPMTTAGFQRDDGRGLMEQFLQDSNKPDNLLKGPWLEIKLPFRTATSATESPLTHVSLGFAPYMHQQRAFGRLATAQPLSTLVATGTGSGKTECFLYPILNYCLQERRKGIKAIIVYPMNASKALDKELRQIREDLTRSLGNKQGRIIRKVALPRLEERLSKLRSKIEDHQKSIKNDLTSVLEESKKMVIDYYAPLITKTPPDELIGIFGEPTKEEIHQWLDKRLSRGFPEVDDLINKIQLNVQFKDVTFSTLNQSDFLGQIKAAYPEVNWDKTYDEYKAAAEQPSAIS